MQTTELELQAQRHSLGQYLTDWQELSYGDVLDILRSKENEFWVSDERIMVWQPFEDVSGDFIADQIETLHTVMSQLALDAYLLGEQSVQ
jgi:hypothetical protein